MKNIVTIDFDIIMAPSIELYNKYVDEYYSVDAFSKDYNNLISFSNADLIIYDKITSYLIDSFMTMNSNDIYFIEDHEQIYDLIKDEEKYNIYNIDHHHDCGYELSRNDLFCGNWVKILKEENKLNSYIWITDEASPDDIKEIGEKKLFYDIDLFSLPQPDIIVICASYEWVPAQFHPLFSLWLKFYNLFSGDAPKKIIKNPRRESIEEK